MTSWFDGLNEEQCQAVRHSDGPLLILAGAGSGKTTVLVSRTGHLITEKGVAANQVAVMTFTNKAARELNERVAEKLGKAAAGLWTGTFHAFGLQLLKKYYRKADLPKGFAVIGPSDVYGIIKEILANLHTAKDAYKIETIYNMICEWREQGRTNARDDGSDDDYEVITELVLPKYVRRLNSLGVVDFHDLLLRPLELLKDPAIKAKVSPQFKYLMVDEFQDTNSLQLKLVRELTSEHNNLAVVGDDDQAIYGWRGACVSNILDFPKAFESCEVIRLERNYRSTAPILKLANKIISNNKERHGKRLIPTAAAEAASSQETPPELFIYETDEDEVAGVITHLKEFHQKNYNWGEMAILYRSNGQGGLLEAELRREDIEYSISGGTGFFDRKEIKDTLAYLRCAILPNEISVRRVINTPPRGIGNESIKKISAYKDEHKMNFYQASKHWEDLVLNARIARSLETFHGEIKGLIPYLENPANGKTPGTRLLSFLKSNGYYNHLIRVYKDLEVMKKRWLGVEVVGRVLDGYAKKTNNLKEAITDFVMGMELRDLAENEDNNKEGKVQLLTLHACKGLEFPGVVLMGLEEDILPHRILGQDVSEERRLFYVGVTRAKKSLVLTQARQRQRFGKLQPVSPSRFLVELPKGLYKEFPSGARPVNEEQKTDLLADLYSKLDSNIQNQRIDDA